VTPGSGYDPLCTLSDLWVPARTRRGRRDVVRVFFGLRPPPSSFPPSGPPSPDQSFSPSCNQLTVIFPWFALVSLPLSPVLHAVFAPLPLGGGFLLVLPNVLVVGLG